MNDPRFRTKDGTLRGDEQTHVWLESEEMYGGMSMIGSWGSMVEHDDGDRYDDEYEHEDFLDTAYALKACARCSSICIHELRFWTPDFDDDLLTA